MSVLLLLVLLLPQEDVEALVRKLGDEGIEAREQARVALLKAGEKARAVLERIAGSDLTASLEIKTEASALLKTLNRVRELRAWVIPPTRVSLSGEMTLREAAEAFEKQGGPKIACASWPDGKFRVDLKDALFWKAMEEICRSSGTRSLLCDAAGPMLAGDRYVQIPSSVDGMLRLQLNGAGERRTVNLDSGGEEKLFVISLALGYENPKAPYRFYVNLDTVQDDQGNELVGGFRPNLRMAPKYEQLFGPRGDALSSLIVDLKSSAIPKPEVARISRLSGAITAYFRASKEDLQIPIQEALREATPVLEVIEESDAKPVIGTVQYYPGGRESGEQRCRLSFKSLDSRLVCEFGDLWKLRDSADKTITGYAGAISDRDSMSPELHLSFQKADLLTADAQFVEVGIPRRLIKKEIRFDLKDIRIK